MAAPLPIGSEPTAETLRLALARLSALPGDLFRILLLAARLGVRPVGQRPPPASTPARR